MPKKITICFDGTSNHPSDAKQEREWFGMGEIEDSGITNVLKLHVLFGGNLRNDPGSDSQHSFYYSGVGTYGIKLQQIFNAGFAPQNLDVGRIIRMAGKDLQATYQPGDEIFIFGFSRGAAIARRFASVLNNYITMEAGERPVRFLGVFDTVASIGIPNISSEDKPVSDVVFENCTISPHVHEALHLISIDENRVVFEPTLMNREGRVREVWFPGAHSDVGGGFWYDGLSDVTLDFMLQHMERAGLGLKVRDPDTIEYDRLVAVDKSYRIDFEDVFVKPNVLGKHHRHDRWWPIAKATLAPRAVRVNENDAPSGSHLPLVFSDTKKRIDEVTDYRPRSLKGIRHHQIGPDGKVVVDEAGKPRIFNGIREYIV